MCLGNEVEGHQDVGVLGVKAIAKQKIKFVLLLIIFVI